VVAIPNDRRLLKEGKNLFDALISTLNTKLGAGKFSILMTNQPLPLYVLKLGSDKNVLGADRMRGNSLLWNVMVSIPTGDNSDAALKIAQDEVKAMTIKMERLAAAAGGNGWVYLNYAGSWQDPLGSYGPKNVGFMKKVSAKYDPKGFWQKRVPGGFKLSNVRG
jgi:hypothetical protein